MKRWLAIALMLIAAGTSSAAAATTTAKYALSNAGWTDLGPGPMLLSFNGPTGVFAISDATPTFKAEGFGKARGGSIKIPTPSHVWGAATGNFGVTAYVAPITGGGGGGGGGCSQATAYLARATGEVTHAADLTTLICGLVTDGVWTNLDTLYVMAQQTETDAKLNLIGTSYPLGQTGSFAQIAPRIGSIGFVAYQGFAGFNTLGTYFDTGFNATTAPTPHFTQNSASFGFWAYAVLDEGVGQMGNGNVGTAGESNIFDSYTGGAFYARVNNATIGSVPTPGTKGLFVGDRSSSANVVPYWNGVAQATQSGVSQAPKNGNFQIGTITGGGTAERLSEAHIGASLGSAGNLALYNRLRTYMTAVGVP